MKATVGIFIFLICFDPVSSCLLLTSLFVRTAVPLNCRLSICRVCKKRRVTRGEWLTIINWVTWIPVIKIYQNRN